MTVYMAYLQKTECYPCTRRETKAAFGDLALSWVGLRWPMRRFRFDSRCRPGPNVAEEGIVCNAAYTPHREGSFSAYPVRMKAPPAHA